VQEAFDLYHKAVKAMREIIDSEDDSDWLDAAAVLVVKSFARLAKQCHTASKQAADGGNALRDACEEIRRLVNSCVRHDRVQHPTIAVVAASALRKSLRHATHVPTPPGKRSMAPWRNTSILQVHLLLVSTVVLYKLFHRLGAIFLMKDLSDPVEKADPAQLSRCPAGELCSYRFFHGMLFVRSS
jgi:hypothetical protein